MKVREILEHIQDQRRYGHYMIIYFNYLDSDYREIEDYDAQRKKEGLPNLIDIMKEFGIKREASEINTDEINKLLKELGPQEIETMDKVIHNIKLYEKFYSIMTNYIFSRYQNIDVDKLENISKEIDESLANMGLGRGDVLLIYNKLNEPFAKNFIRPYVKLPDIINPIRDINTLIKILHPNLDMRTIDKTIKNIEVKVDKLNLKYEEKWLLYNFLSHIYIKDLIETMESTK